MTRQLNLWLLYYYRSLFFDLSYGLYLFLSFNIVNIFVAYISLLIDFFFFFNNGWEIFILLKAPINETNNINENSENNDKF